jgi:hypothetical protein
LSSCFGKRISNLERTWSLSTRETNRLVMDLRFLWSLGNAFARRTPTPEGFGTSVKGKDITITRDILNFFLPCMSLLDLQFLEFLFGLPYRSPRLPC